MVLTQPLHVVTAAHTVAVPAAMGGALPTVTHLPGGVVAPHMGQEAGLMVQEAGLMAQEAEAMAQLTVQEEAMGHRMPQEEGLMAQEVGLMAQVLMVAQATALVLLSHLILCIRT